MLENRVVAVTGAARGIGLAIANECATRGMRVALGDLKGAEAAAREIGGVGLELDVTDRESFRRFLDEVEQRLDEVQVLVNNAGIMMVGPLRDAGPSASKTIDVNVKGVLNGMQLAIPRLRRGGQIVNVVSSSGFVAPPYLATYAASKHAARALTDAVREEVRAAGIAVTGVYPGVVDTDLAAGTSAPRGQRMIQPQEVARAVADAIERPRPDVFVPRSLGASLRLWAALPPRGRALAARAFGVDRLYAGVDPESRREYEQALGA